MRYCKACGQQLPFGEGDPIRWAEAVARKAAQAAEARAAQARRDAARKRKPKFTGKKKRSYPESPSLSDL